MPLHEVTKLVLEPGPRGISLAKIVIAGVDRDPPGVLAEVPYPNSVAPRAKDLQMPHQSRDDVVTKVLSIWVQENTAGTTEAVAKAIADRSPDARNRILEYQLLEQAFAFGVVSGLKISS